MSLGFFVGSHFSPGPGLAERFLREPLLRVGAGFPTVESTSCGKPAGNFRSQRKARAPGMQVPGVLNRIA